MTGLFQDLRYAIRQLRKSPAFAITAILTLALGIGANTAMFTLVSVFLLRQLPFRQPERLVSLSIDDPALAPEDAVSWPDGFTFPMFLQLSKEQQVFTHLVAYYEGALRSLQSSTASETGNVMLETGDFFSVAGVPPLLGRWIRPDEDGSTGGQRSQVAVISYDCWQNLFAGSSTILGKTISMDGNPFTIVGVMPKQFIGLRVDSAAQAIIPLRRPATAAEANSMILPLLGQLRPGTSIEMARAQIGTIWEHLKAETTPPSLSDFERSSFLARRITFRSAATGFLMTRELYRKPLLRLWMMVVIVLMIACTNLGTLMLARTLHRKHEMAIRSALGAPRLVLLRQMLVECLLLAFCGTLPGLLIAFYASRWLASQFWLSVFPMNLSFAPDARVLAFATGTTLVTVLLFAVVPAWIGSRNHPRLALQSAGRAFIGRASSFVGNALLAGQIALSLVLLVVAVQLVFSTRLLLEADLGLQTAGVLDIKLIQRGAGYKDFNAAPYYRDLQQQLEQIPGVQSVGLANAAIFPPFLFTGKVATLDQTITVDASYARPISPGYLPTLKIPFERGRDFQFSDDTAHPAVAIINRSLASKLFPNRDALGQHVRIGDPSRASEAGVIGVVADANLDDPRRPALPAVYISFFQKPEYMRNPDVLLGVTRDPAQVQRRVREIVSSLGREDLLGTDTLNERLKEALLTERMSALLSAMFGLLALLLNGIGTAGLFSCLIAQRIPEIGLRMVFGARRRDVLAMILRQVCAVVLAGTLAGIPFAWMATHQLSTFLYRHMTLSLDVVSVCLALLFVSILAAFFPARRAAKVDPMVALRYE